MSLRITVYFGSFVSITFNKPFIEMRLFDVLHMLIFAILLAVNSSSVSGHSRHNSNMEEEFKSLKSFIKLLRNRAGILHAKNAEFQSRKDHALLALKKKEKEDNAAVQSIANHMKKGLTEILDRVETNPHANRI